MNLKPQVEVNLAEEKEKEDLECDNCGKINCYVCGRNKYIHLCIKKLSFSKCDDPCIYLPMSGL